jgi:hypothetical protein
VPNRGNGDSLRNVITTIGKHLAVGVLPVIRQAVGHSTIVVGPWLLAADIQEAGLTVVILQPIIQVARLVPVNAKIAVEEAGDGVEVVAAVPTERKR